MTGVPEALYRVVEIVDGEFQGKVVASARWMSEPISYNAKKRLYDGLPQARMYKRRLINEGRDARILKYSFEGEVQ